MLMGNIPPMAGSSLPAKRKRKNVLAQGKRKRNNTIHHSPLTAKGQVKRTKAINKIAEYRQANDPKLQHPKSPHALRPNPADNTTMQSAKRVAHELHKKAAIQKIRNGGLKQRPVQPKPII